MSGLAKTTKPKSGVAKKLKSGDGLKDVVTIIDSNILSESIGQSLLTNLSSNGITCRTNVSTKNLVKWQRKNQQTFVQNDENIELSDKFTDEDFVLKLVTAQEFNAEIDRQTVMTTMQRLTNEQPSKKFTIVVCGIKEFCRTNKNVGRHSFETTLAKLAELQVLLNINSRLIETSADLNITVLQFTKSIADIPYKQQQREQLDGQNFYVTNDNKDCVAVKGTTGLSSLWQHHLTKLPMVALETAESIIAEYPMPCSLLEAYDNSSNGPDLLANIPVRRAGGPLTSVRKIGPELSRKLHALYTNTDPNYIL